jgi:hypothetical protein
LISASTSPSSSNACPRGHFIITWLEKGGSG